MPIAISVYRTANQQDREQNLGGEEALVVSVGLLVLNGAVILSYLVCAGIAAGSKLRVLLKRCCCCIVVGGNNNARADIRRGPLHEDLLGDMSMSTRSLATMGGSPRDEYQRA